MKKVMFLLVGFIFIGSAQAATFDFQHYADVTDGEGGYSEFTKTEDGITVTATGTAGKDAAFAYLDAGQAGLGVCKVLGYTGQCDPGGDDNVLQGEAVKLSFASEVLLTDIWFVDGKHEGFGKGAGTFDLYVDNMFKAAYSLADIITFDIIGSVFEFVNTSLTAWEQDDQFYIAKVNAVPIPAALFLFAPALLGFFGLRRKTALAA